MEEGSWHLQEQKEDQRSWVIESEVGELRQELWTELHQAMQRVTVIIWGFSSRAVEPPRDVQFLASGRNGMCPRAELSR